MWRHLAGGLTIAAPEPTLNGQMMRLIHTISDLNQAIHDSRCAFVPTMGALHAGHVALIRKAAELATPADPVLVSVFVNPTQFGPNEDFSRYPRTLEADIRAAEAAGASIVFAPDVLTMYPPDERIEPPPLPAAATQPGLEDAFRPTHFAGVCQVVARLFDLVRPSLAVFGEKDFQQLRVIQMMVQQQGERWPGLKIAPHPTIREPDGLAMSSRNAYLKPHERHRALGLYAALQAAAAASTPAEAEQAMNATLRSHDLQIDYAVVRDADTLLPTRDFRQPARALIAARLGSVRLIDNAPLGPIENASQL